MKVFYITLIIFLIIYLITIIVFLHCIYKEYKEDIHPDSFSYRYSVIRKNAKMKFKEWKKLYLINKSRYIYCDKGLFFHSIDENKEEEIFYQIKFNFLDYLKLIWFWGNEKKEKYKKNQENNEALIDILEITQKDIDKLKETSYSEIKKVTNFIDALEKEL